MPGERAAAAQCVDATVQQGGDCVRPHLGAAAGLHRVAEPYTWDVGRRRQRGAARQTHSARSLMFQRANLAGGIGDNQQEPGQK
jgi:hypothetical protein